MSTVNVIKSSFESIHEISNQLREAVVYLDAGCTESFQFLGAFSLLLEHGARAVCCLEDMSPLDMIADWNGTSDSATKVVIMTSCLLSDVHRYTLRCLGAHPSIQWCYIFTSISEVAHSAYPDSPLGPDAFHEYESLLMQDYEELSNKHKTKVKGPDERNISEKLASEEEGWAQLDDKDISHIAAGPNVSSMYLDNAKLNEQKLVVSVLHFPMIFCPLSPNFFVLPSGGSVAQASLSAENEHSLSPGLPPLSTGDAADGEDIPGATLTAHFLYYLASKMDLKLEIFSFGDQSKTVGRILTDMSSLYDVGRRKRSAGLLLIDRTLDLLTPCSHADSFLDRVFSALPRRERSPSSNTKNLQAQAKPKARIQRSPLDVLIPLDNIFSKESEAENFRLQENIENFLRGWNSRSSDSKIQGLIDLSSKLQDEQSSDSIKNMFDGSFMATESFHGTPYLEALLGRRIKDGAVLVKKWLLETLRKENISVNVKTRPGSATRSELEPMIKALAKSDASLLKNKGIFQLAAATLAALDDLHRDKWDAFISAEKMLHVSAGDTSQSLAAQIVIGYILAGQNFPTSGSTSPFSWQEEHLMKEAIVDAVFENPELGELKFVHGLAVELEAYRSKINSKEKKATKDLSIDDFDDDDWGNWGDEDADSNKEQGYDDMQLKLELRDRVDNLFRFLYKLSGLNSRNIQLREGPFGSELGIGGDSFEGKGLLYKLLLRALGKYDIPGLEHHSSAVGRLFGRFGLGQAKPSLADQNVILVFVVGGTNGQEVHEAFEALSESERPNIELIVGGTTLLTPNDMLELLLGNSSYF
ncbi:unnamed protein product [Amaranthus hypochondriacus]